jgi:hypothetical protein
VMRSLVAIANRVAARVYASMEVKYFMVEAPDLKPQLVVVDDAHAQAWADEKNYLVDAGIKLSIVEIHPWIPGDLSDELAPRDD